MKTILRLVRFRAILCIEDREKPKPKSQRYKIFLGQPFEL